MINTLNSSWIDHRPSWDSYFLSLCFVVSQRSIDIHTKHGSVIVNKDKTILSVGFNGPPRGGIDSKVPLTRPDKYDYLIHSESAAILNAARHGISLLGSTLYVTGFPCHLCFREIINVGINEVLFGPVGSACVDEKSRNIVQEMCVGRNIKIYPLDVDVIKEVKNVLSSANNIVGTF